MNQKFKTPLDFNRIESMRSHFLQTLLVILHLLYYSGIGAIPLNWRTLP